jgi:hypothetical protein
MYGETPSPSPTVSPCESEPDNFHKSQTYGLASVKARNTDTAILCGCIGHFFWEIVPAKNLAFYRVTAPDMLSTVYHPVACVLLLMMPIGQLTMHV